MDAKHDCQADGMDMSKKQKKKARKKSKAKRTQKHGGQGASLSKPSSQKEQFQDLNAKSSSDLIDASRDQGQEKKESIKEEQIKGEEGQVKSTPHWIKGFLVLFFGFQMYIPWQYYQGDYPWDERFSWRMFSTVRTLKCSPRFWTQSPTTSYKRPLRLGKEMHIVWINLMKRGRLRVIRQFADDYCQNHPGHSLYGSLSCPHPKPPHSSLSLIKPDQDLCSSDTIRTEIEKIDFDPSLNVQ